MDPNTGLNACPISNTSAGRGISGVIIVCPLYESDGKTLSPLAGQVVVRNLMQGKFALIAHPGSHPRGERRGMAADQLVGRRSLPGFLHQVRGTGLLPGIRAGRLPRVFRDGQPQDHQRSLDGSLQWNEPDTNITSVYGPPCRNTINGQVTNLHSPRSPSETLYGSGVFAQGDARNYAPLAYTNCFAAIGDTDGATIAFAKCDPNGNFSVSGLPDGNYGVVIFDQWDDFILDGSSRPANVHGGAGSRQARARRSIWNSRRSPGRRTCGSNTYMDLNGNGIQDPGEPGLIQVPVRVRQVNGKPLNTEF